METPGLGEESKRGARRKRNLRLKAPPDLSIPFPPSEECAGDPGPRAQGPGLETVISREGKEGWSCPSHTQPITACCSPAL